MIDFRLKVFQSVAKNLSFTKAAQELFISQPAVTKHIQELESNYNTRLFERNGNSISLTEAGKLLQKHCIYILDAYKQLDYEMYLLQEMQQGELRLGASTTIAQYVLPPLLGNFISKFPQIKLSLLNGNSRDIETALQQHHIDLGLVEGYQQLPTLHYEKFLKDELVAIVSTHSELSNTLPDEITAKELPDIPLVLRERGSGTLDIIEHALQQQDIRIADLHVLLYLGNTEGIKLFLQNANCMGIVSFRSITKELKAGLFRIIEIKDLDMFRYFNFVCLQGEKNNLTQMFMDYFQHHFR